MPLPLSALPYAQERPLDRGGGIPRWSNKLEKLRKVDATALVRVGRAEHRGALPARQPDAVRVERDPQLLARDDACASRGGVGRQQGEGGRGGREGGSAVPSRFVSMR